MEEVTSVYTQGVIAAIEQFTLAGEELRQFVIYTYYDKDEQPLYVGASKDFYNAHYFNSQRLSYFGEVEYVGFVFLKNEANMKESKSFYIRARQPKYGRSKYPNLPYLKGCDVHTDDVVVSVTEMEQRWREWLGQDEEEDFEEHKEFYADWQKKICEMVKIQRDLTEEEKKCINYWWLMDINDFTLKKAYETTMIRAGKFSFEYMNRLLLAWEG